MIKVRKMQTPASAKALLGKAFGAEVEELTTVCNSKI